MVNTRFTHCLFNLLGISHEREFNLRKTNAANEGWLADCQTYCHTHSNSLSNKMGNSLLAVRGINHKYIVVVRERYVMSKKIVVITGSPRKNGNSFAMTDAFIKAAEEKGHTVTRFNAAMMKLGGCHACETCYSTGKACTFDDDFNTIASAVLEADAIVFTMPVYWYSIPAQIKAVIDRLYSLVVGGKDIAGKECALIACCEEEDLTVLDGVRIPMERTAALNKWKMVGEVLIPGVLNTGDIEKTDGCAQAAALADKI